MTKELNRKWLRKEIGNYFKEARIKANVTQLEIARLLKVTPQYICNYESGAAGFGGDLLKGFIKHYNLSTKSVLNDLTTIQRKYLEAELCGQKLKIVNY